MPAEVTLPRSKAWERNAAWKGSKTKPKQRRTPKSQVASLAFFKRNGLSCLPGKGRCTPWHAIHFDLITCREDRQRGGRRDSKARKDRAR
ncbi:hypothetical protein EYF80_017378 [Liparis tanakae]|uniref:Uncharacterized protein n=1 Tax=Liparis tanakae TaxID=230148 RepID=A0A4Z2I5A1_9TELE|nr:hypothetical protein EYF80_017378 [Liparis tanakae]